MQIVHVDADGFEFLADRYIKHHRFPRQKSLAKFKETIRDKTKRTHRHSMQSIIANVNRTLRGWYAYFKRKGLGDFEIDHDNVRVAIFSVVSQCDNVRVRRQLRMHVYIGHISPPLRRCGQVCGILIATRPSIESLADPRSTDNGAPGRRLLFFSKPTTVCLGMTRQILHQVRGRISHSM